MNGNTGTRKHEQNSPPIPPMVLVFHRSAGMFQYALPPGWGGVTAAVCCVAFPVVDPLVAQAWSTLLGAVSSSAASNASGGVLVSQVGSSCQCECGGAMLAVVCSCHR